MVIAVCFRITSPETGILPAAGGENTDNQCCVRSVSQTRTCTFPVIGGKCRKPMLCAVCFADPDLHFPGKKRETNACSMRLFRETAQNPQQMQ